MIQSKIVVAKCMTRALAHEVFEQNKGVSFEMPLFLNDDSPKTTIVLKEEECDIDMLDLVQDFADELRRSTNGELQLAHIHYVKNGFGFSDGYETFCHAKKLVGTTTDFETLCNDGAYFIIHSYESEKGLTASWFCPYGCIDGKTRAKLLPSMLQTLLNHEVDKAREQYWENEEIRREEEIEAKLAAIGISGYKQKVWSKRQTYGGHKQCTYIFDRAISKESFKEFLRITGQVTEAKPCLYPICPEQVRYSTSDQGVTWEYEWNGEWND